MAGKAFFGSLCVATFGLGAWQMQRYVEKVALVETRERELTDDPVPFSEHHDGFRRVSVRGTFDHAKYVLVGPRGPPPGAMASSGPNSGRSSGGMSSSPQGFFVMTPLEQSNGEGTLIINRGWVPMNVVQGNKIAPDARNWEEPTGEVEIVGVPTQVDEPRYFSPPHDERHQRRLLWMDRIGLDAKTGTSGAPIVAQTSEQPEEHFPISPNASGLGEFKVGPATHAGYALTWFGLSGAGLVMTRKLLTRGR